MRAGRYRSVPGLTVAAQPVRADMDFAPLQIGYLVARNTLPHRYKGVCCTIRGIWYATVRSAENHDDVSDHLECRCCMQHLFPRSHTYLRALVFLLVLDNCVLRLNDSVLFIQLHALLIHLPPKRVHVFTHDIHMGCDNLRVYLSSLASPARPFLWWGKDICLATRRESDMPSSNWCSAMAI